MPRRKVTDPVILVEAAARLFQRKGYQNTTIDDLAEEVGVSKPTVYQYVKSKGWLLETMFETVLRRLKDDLDDVITSTRDPEAQFCKLMRLFVHRVTDQQAYFHIFVGEEAELPARTRRKFRAAEREITDRFGEIIEACATNGNVHSEVDSRMAAFLIVGMITSIARWYDPKGPLTPDEIAEQATGILKGYTSRGAAGALASSAR